MHNHIDGIKAPRRWVSGLRRGARFAGRVLTIPRSPRRFSPFGAPEAPTISRPVSDELSASGQGQQAAGKSASMTESASVLPGIHTTRRRFGFLLTNALTACSIALGMLAIVAATHGSVRWAAFAVLGCVVCDGLDGFVARRFGVTTPFGANMDSLADMCSFGIATPIVAYAWLGGAVSPLVVLPVCALMAVCAAIRLARFNISPKSGAYFTGVPTTMAAGIVVLGALFMPEPAQTAAAFAGVGVVALLALLMVSAFPYVKFGQLRRMPVWLWAIPLGVAVFNPLAGLGTVVGGYLASGPFLARRARS